MDLQSVGDIDNYRYSAPETQFPMDHSEGVTPSTYEGNVYGIGMIAYEVSSYSPGPSGPGSSNLTLIS